MADIKLFDADLYAKQTFKAANALFDYPTAGVVQTVDTITDIVQGVVETKYYELQGQSLTDFINIDASGRGAYAGQITQFVSAFVGAPFKECITNPASTGIHNDATADVIVDAISQKNNFYRQKYSISQEELRMAAVNRVGFDLIEQKEKARKKTWDLGLQEVLFNGLGDGRTFGLLNQSGVTVNTSLLPKAPEAMTTAQLKTFAATALAAAAANSNYTIMPNRWCMPTSSYMALGIPYGDTFGMPTVKEVLERAFKEAGAPADFKIVHSKYNEGIGSQSKGRHVFYNTDSDNIIMHTPKPYTPHPLYAIGALDMISDAEGQFTGVWVKRPGAILYADVQA
jgi:hypothetical protein